VIIGRMNVNLYSVELFHNAADGEGGEIFHVTVPLLGSVSML
jgi:hypothetical protein